jgi:hypothetical protein
MSGYIPSKIAEWQEKGIEPEYRSLSVAEFAREFDYATKYLSRMLKVRPFVMFLLLFKRAYFVEGKRSISIRLSELGENLLSDLGLPMSHDVVKRGINDLVHLKIISRVPSRPGQVNEYEIRLPSEVREVQEMIQAESKCGDSDVDLRFDDYYTDPQKRLEVLKRDGYKCFYCLREVQRDTFYLDHLEPRTQGGQNWQSNLVCSCKNCNSKKNASDATAFFRDIYRQDLLTQEEFSSQKQKMDILIREYEMLKEERAELRLAQQRITSASR